jgi:tetratricopeptide (TPR) repeat protein
MVRKVTRLHVYGGRPLGAILLSVLVLPTGAIAQVAGSFGHPDETRVVQTTAPNTGILTFKVLAERNGPQLSRQAIVRLVNLADQSTTVQATQDNSQSVFTNIPYGDYSAEVSAVGYLSSHQDLKVSAIRSILNFDIVIRRDPSAVNFDIADSMVSERARKETKRAISALKSNKLSDAQKHLDLARTAAPADPGVNFLLGYLYFQKKDLPQAATYLATATTLNPGNAQALTLLGRVDLEQKDYLPAASALERAIQISAEDWLPHNLLADAYLHEKNYPRARDEAQIAIGKGRNDASASQLVLGEAFLNLGENEQGIRALQAFLQQSPAHPVAGQVRSLIAQVQDQTSSPPTLVAAVQQPQIRLSGVDPLLALPAPSLSMKAWQPPGIDDVKLAIAAGVSCPANLAEETGKRVQELADDNHEICRRRGAISPGARQLRHSASHREAAV